MLSQQRALDPLSAPVHRPRVQCQLAIGLAIYATPGAVQVIHQWSSPFRDTNSKPPYRIWPLYVLKQ